MSLTSEEVFGSRHPKRRNPERAVQKAVLIYLRAIGCLVAVTDAGAAYKAGGFFGQGLPAGWPDITGLLPSGQFIGVECKAPGGKQSPAQKHIEGEILRRHGRYILVTELRQLQALLPTVQKDGNPHERP